MTKERLKSPRARLFVALDLPDDVRTALAAWQSQECADEALRPLPVEALHVTLCFIGYQPEREIPRIGKLLGQIEPRPVPMRFEPEPVGIRGGRPGLFAASAPSEAARELQAELSGALAKARLYRPEKRPFWPHVTVARVRPERRAGGGAGRRRGSRPRVVERPPGPLSQGLLHQWGAVRVALYRSHLRSSGARYERLSGLELPPAASGRER